MSKVGLDENKPIVGAVSFKNLGLYRVTFKGLPSNRMHGVDSREFVLCLVLLGIVMGIGIKG